MRFLAIVFACSCVSTSPNPTDPSGSPSDLGEIPVVGTLGEAAPIVRTYDDADHGSDACHAVSIADDGTFVVAGEVQRLSDGRNAWARRYDADGEVVWTYELHTPSEGSDAARGVIALTNGGAVLAGQWYSGSPTAQNHFVAQLAADGVPQWLAEAELDGPDGYASVARTATGDLVVAGALGAQAWLQELAATDGAVHWDATQGSDAAARRVAVTASGDVLVGGASGNTGWVSRYHGPQLVATQQLPARVDDLAATGDGVAVVAGGVLAVYSATGAMQWQTDPSASWRAVAARADGTLVVAGKLGDALAVRVYGADGTQLSEATVPDAVPEAIATNSAGDIVACGVRANDVFAVKFPR